MAGYVSETSELEAAEGEMDRTRGRVRGMPNMVWLKGTEVMRGGAQRLW